VSTNLSPAELAALRGGRSTDPAPAVSPWEIGRIRRLSGDDVAEATRIVERALPQIETRLREMAGLPVAARLAACHEVSAQDLLADAEDPLALVCFEVSGQPGWCLWDTSMAVATIEAVLVGLSPAPEPGEGEEGEAADPSAKEGAGAESTSTPPAEGAAEGEPSAPQRPPFDPAAYRRPLTPMERRVLVRVLGLVVERLCTALGIAPTKLDAAELKKQATTWLDTNGPRPDPYRLAVDVALETEIGTSIVSLYLPMTGARGPLAAPDAAKPKPNATKAPEHLEPVPLVVDAVLGTAEISLADLMALEVGDVVPISAAVGDPVRLSANGIEFARGRMGTHRGHVTISLLGDTAPTQKKP